jgi:hypothetical protein
MSAENSKDEPEGLSLTEVQKEKIRLAFANGESPNLTNLVKEVFDNQRLDSRSREGRLVKAYIAEFNIGKFKINFRNKTDEIELSEEQKSTITKEIDSSDFSTLSMAKKIFNNESITPLHKEHRVVRDFVINFKNKKDLENLNVQPDGGFVSTSYIASEKKNIPYKHPVNIAQAIARINKYLNYGWKEEDLKKSQIKWVESLMSYLKVFRFQYQINSYSRMEDRELFEDAFIRYTHDKDDLSQEEIDQFITLSNEVVIAADIQRRIDYLRTSLDEMASDSEGKKISMGLNEAINNAQTEYNQCISRQDKLYKSLTINRSKRIDEKRSENASILNLVYAWKQEENRARMIALAERQREALQLEVEKLSSMDEFKAIIRGMDPKEILNT